MGDRGPRKGSTRPNYPIRDCSAKARHWLEDDAALAITPLREPTEREFKMRTSYPLVRMAVGEAINIPNRKLNRHSLIVIIRNRELTYGRKYRIVEHEEFIEVVRTR
jgi:hypothetical protein